MKKLPSDIGKIVLRFSPNEGTNQSPVPGVSCVKYSAEDRRTRRAWRACLAIVVQGCKEVVLNREVFRCEEAFYTATPVELPVLSQVVSASQNKPFLAILIDLDLSILNGISRNIKNEPQKKDVAPAAAFFRGATNEKMHEATSRLIRLFESSEEALVLGPLIINEIFYHLLKSEEGAAIRQYVHSGTKMNKIAKAVHTIQSDLSEKLDTSSLAKASNMSRSNFFKTFTEATSMGPIQYQKRLRLLEAKRLMINENETAEGAASRVGYKSASQFNREYSRMFGKSPLRDVHKEKIR